MLFSSYVFVLLFLPLALLSFYGVYQWKGSSAARSVLIGFSLLFYVWWNPIYIVLLLASIGFNFYCARAMQSEKAMQSAPSSAGLKKRYLQVGITLNLLFLAYFKYADFFIANINAVAGSQWPLLQVVLPLAISFFTLQQIAFLVDVYEGLTREKSFKNYLWFVAFFPQLIAGPIVNHKQSVQQFAREHFGRFDSQGFAYGLFVFVIGLFKKVVIADSLRLLADAGYANLAQLSTVEAWLCTVAYTFQAYFDFSGYSDMAVGLGLLFGIVLPINFKSPYKATSIIEFWQRWHITLTDFINAYLYMPLMRLRQTFSFHYSLCVTVIVMAVVGLWHGASWTFVWFGILHGLALVVNHVWRRLNVNLPRLFNAALTLLWWHITLVVFRSSSMAEAGQMLKVLFAWPLSPADLDSGLSFTVSKWIVDSIPMLNRVPQDVYAWVLGILFGVLLLACLRLKNPHEHRDLFKPSFRYFVVTLCCFVWSVLMMGHVAEFIYFQF